MYVHVHLYILSSSLLALSACTMFKCTRQLVQAHTKSLMQIAIWLLYTYTYNVPTIQYSCTVHVHVYTMCTCGCYSEVFMYTVIVNLLVSMITFVHVCTCKCPQTWAEELWVQPVRGLRHWPHSQHRRGSHKASGHQDHRLQEDWGSVSTQNESF